MTFELFFCSLVLCRMKKEKWWHLLSVKTMLAVLELGLQSTILYIFSWYRSLLTIVCMVTGLQVLFPMAPREVMKVYGCFLLAANIC